MPGPNILVAVANWPDQSLIIGAYTSVPMALKDCQEYLEDNVCDDDMPDVDWKKEVQEVADCFKRAAHDTIRVLDVDEVLWFEIHGMELEQRQYYGSFEDKEAEA